MADQVEGRVAVYIDFDNIVISRYDQLHGNQAWRNDNARNVIPAKRGGDATAKKLGLDPNRVVVTVDQHANTSAASVPLALDVAVRDGRVKAGDLVVLEAMGGGFTWGAAVVRF